MGTDRHVMPAPEPQIKSAQTFTHTRGPFASLRIKVDVGVKTGDLDLIFLHRLEPRISVLFRNGAGPAAAW
jgi:hypothetical protein